MLSREQLSMYYVNAQMERMYKEFNTRHETSIAILLDKNAI